MRNSLLFLLSIALLAVAASGVNQLASAGPMTQNDPINLPHTLTQQLQRACVFEGDWTIVDCSAGAAYSTELDEWARYVLQAVGGDAYWTPTKVASGDDADANDGYIPAGAMLEHVTTDLTTYYSCDSVLIGAAGDVRHIKCR